MIKSYLDGLHYYAAVLLCVNRTSYKGLSQPEDPPHDVIIATYMCKLKLGGVVGFTLCVFRISPGLHSSHSAVE